MLGCPVPTCTRVNAGGRKDWLRKVHSIARLPDNPPTFRLVLVMVVCYKHLRPPAGVFWSCLFKGGQEDTGVPRKSQQCRV
jgi:hypothetical protein